MVSRYLRDDEQISALARVLRRYPDLSCINAARVALDAGFILREAERLLAAAIVAETARRAVYGRC